MAAGHANDSNPLTRSYSEPFPIPNRHQFNTINKVINALPDGTDSWQPLDETCHSLGVDESYLPLFLKLGLERGKDWNQKWDNAKHSLATRGFNVKAKVTVAAAEAESVDSRAGVRVRAVRAGGFEVLKAKVEQLNKRDRNKHNQAFAQPRPSQPESNQVTQNASRSPRFPPTNAAAGPSLVPPREFLVEPRTDYHSSSDDYAGVPSRPTIHKLQPRHAPLTSTPRHSSTPLVDSAISARAAKPKPATPAQPLTSSPALNHFINSRAPQLKPSTQTAAFADPSNSSIQSVRLATVLEARADDFRRLSLLSQGWYAWQATASQLHARQAHLDQARRAVLLRWAFLKWRARTAQLQELEQVGREVERAREKDLTKRTVVRWVEAIDKKRRQEWEEGLREAWDKTRASWKARLARDALGHWQAVAMERRALRFRQDKLAAAALAKWRGRASQVGALEAGAVKYDQQMTQHKALDHWRHVARLRQLERGLTETKDRAVLSGVLERWRDRT